MALNFPDPATQTPVNTWSPTSTPSASTNGLTYLWDGAKWTTEGGVPNLHWTRAGSVLSPTNAGDDVTTTGDVNAANVVATGDVQTTSLNGGPIGGMRNQIINGSMTIAQRGSTKNNFGPAFQPETVDRWIFAAAAPVQVNATRVNNFFPEAPAGYSLELGAASGDSANIRLGQTVELEVPGTQSQFVKGSEWTFSWYSSYSQVTTEFAFVDDGRLTNQVFMTDVDTRKSLGNSRYSITFRIDKDVAPGFTSRALMVWMKGFTNPTRIGCCQLEPGSVATPFEHRPIGTELALCQRYYEVLDVFEGNAVNGSTIALLATSRNIVTKRDIPTVTRIGNTVWSGSAAGFTTVVPINNACYFGSSGLSASDVQLGGLYSFDAEL